MVMPVPVLVGHPAVVTKALKVNGGGSKYRFVNETETYAEFKLGQELYKDGHQSHLFRYQSCIFSEIQQVDWKLPA